MILLPKSIAALGSGEFHSTLKQEIEEINIHELPLQAAMAQSSYVSESPFSVSLLNVKEESELLVVKVGVFYSGVVAGCNCSDDPSPINENNEYCELQFAINTDTTEAVVRLL